MKNEPLHVKNGRSIYGLKCHLRDDTKLRKVSNWVSSVEEMFLDFYLFRCDESLEVQRSGNEGFAQFTGFDCATCKYDL